MITMLQDRNEAGCLLAEKLGRYRDDPKATVLALPRGGVVVGAAIADRLHLPLDCFIVRKIGAPTNPEYAVGAVTETGFVVLNAQALSELGLSRPLLDELIARRREEMAIQHATYRGGRALPDLTERVVILVDDGVATGATFSAAAEAVRALHPRRLVAALPVGPESSLERIRAQVDELLVLQIPDPFYAVGNHYTCFDQVEDVEVIRCLQAGREPSA